MLAITAFAHPPALDSDPDTSMVCSLVLHLMSEHCVLDALTLEPHAAEELHTRLHFQVCEHPLGDLRFRPGRAMAVLVSRHENLRRTFIPDTSPTLRA